MSIYKKEGRLTISDDDTCDICGSKPVAEYVGRGGDTFEKYCKAHIIYSGSDSIKKTQERLTNDSKRSTN